MPLPVSSLVQGILYQFLCSPPAAPNGTHIPPLPPSHINGSASGGSSGSAINGAGALQSLAATGGRVCTPAAALVSSRPFAIVIASVLVFIPFSFFKTLDKLR